MISPKQKIGLVVDDICSLPEKIINEYQIEIVKTKLFFPEWEKFFHPPKFSRGKFRRVE